MHGSCMVEAAKPMRNALRADPLVNILSEIATGSGDTWYVTLEHKEWSLGHRGRMEAYFDVLGHIKFKKWQALFDD